MPEHVRSAIAADAAACLAVYRPYVLDTVITFETEVPTVEEMAARIVAARVMHEWLVLEVAGDVAGYAYAQQFNPRAAYRWSVETSVYMARDRVRTGGGRKLYAELLSRLAARGFRRAFAAIAQPNDASNALHEAFGFQPAGRLRRVGWKHGAWHDVQWWQLDLVACEDEVDPPREIAP
ncbi:N-acetyltransferase family protein [Mycobacterium kansasii]|uniref:Phosphinothricin N-acetyltransferase n=3 Tax=Mycobacterium kansasii TaxID=1768 RepID=A0A1V3XZP6_MYCKA|nr:GNAT family N-acetyltransferase [Mycobacterium kansasii]EUA03466.1 phosphinothricin N-acetyltransferase [Mycobacterium kansasii 824]AGZ52730.1 GCN5 family acetyltransferase [Mycobacterium kansasii ATCC 12478]ARG55608.1 N-acetyltransferase [Mycobacterium kansasii]ARG61052.1 N-acetyltransferase [Mycobacterium kansasii]ARG76636.1 N-acetyltransferase [Mycobacterium kansasii]